MSDPGVAGADAFCHFEGAFEAEVGDVAATADAVDHEMIQFLQLVELFICNVIHVGAIGYVAETVAQNWKLEMLASDRHNFHSVNAERMLINQMHVPFWCTRIAIFSEGI